MDPESTMYDQLDLSQIMTVDFDARHHCLQLCSLSTFKNTLIETTVSLVITSPDLVLVTKLAEEHLISTKTPLFNESGEQVGCVDDYLNRHREPFSIFTRKKGRRRLFTSTSLS
ncbi:MAG: hypothetical protein ACRDD4_10550 [Culicoidibacterales bacterium]